LVALWLFGIAAPWSAATQIEAGYAQSDRVPPSVNGSGTGTLTINRR